VGRGGTGRARLPEPDSAEASALPAFNFLLESSRDFSFSGLGGIGGLDADPRLETLSDLLREADGGATATLPTAGSDPADGATVSCMATRTASG